MLLKKMFTAMISGIISLTIIMQFNAFAANAVENVPEKSIKRIQGLDRIKTSIAIAEELKTGKFDNIVLSYAYNFPDALSGSTLSKKLNAPILLVGTMKESGEVLNYIVSNLSKNGNVYILGGPGAVGMDIQNYLSQEGYNIIRLYGNDRIGTCNAIIDYMNIKTKTPLFIASANSFADALSASGIAASKGYPILLSDKDSIDKLMKEQLSKIAPENIFIVGGTGVISTSVENEIKKIVPSAKVERLSGVDRYETSMNVYERFNSGNGNIVLSSGNNFPDALSGSMLAAKLDTSIMLSDELNLDVQQAKFDQKGIKKYFLLGGTGALSGNVELAILFDRDREIENIKTLFTKASDALKNYDIDEYMSTVDESAPDYQSTRIITEDLMYFLYQYDLDIKFTLDSMDVVSINYREAVIKTHETVAITNKASNTTQYTDGQTVYTLRKTNGLWKVHHTDSL